MKALVRPRDLPRLLPRDSERGVQRRPPATKPSPAWALRAWVADPVVPAFRALEGAYRQRRRARQRVKAVLRRLLRLSVGWGPTRSLYAACDVAAVAAYPADVAAPTGGRPIVLIPPNDQLALRAAGAHIDRTLFAAAAAFGALVFIALAVQFARPR